MILSNFELGWLVGILEGEGHFDFNGSSQKVQLRMCDEDTMISSSNLLSKVLEHHVEVKRREPADANKQDIYEITLSGENARIVMRTVVPYMSYRRRQKIWQSLNKYRQPKNTLKMDLGELLGLK